MKKARKMVPVGFEPTPPKRPRPERGALDHSARAPNAGGTPLSLTTMLYILGSYFDGA